MHRLGSFHFWLPRFADQLLDRWHSGYSPFAHLYQCAKAGIARYVRTPHLAAKHKHRIRSCPAERRGGFPEDRGIAQIVTTTFVRPPKEPPGRDSERIGGVDGLVNSVYVHSA